MDLSLFDYDAAAPFELQPLPGPTIENLRFASPSGNQLEAYLITPPGDGPFPAILYVHWYEPHSILSNRCEFLSEAVALAGEGVISLLVSTMWSDVSWYTQRRRHEDYAHSIRQVIDLRRSLDLLASRPKVDADRLGYVGHDFGGMYGAVLAALDKRIQTFVLMAATTRFSDWMLYGAQIEGAEREAYIQQMSTFDPLKYIGQAAPASVLLQFAEGDFYVSAERAQEFYDAAHEPKKVETYTAGHDLDDRARHTRVQWLREHLKFGG